MNRPFFAMRTEFGSVAVDGGYSEIRIYEKGIFKFAFLSNLLDSVSTKTDFNAWICKITTSSHNHGSVENVPVVKETISTSIALSCSK